VSKTVENETYYPSTTPVVKVDRFVEPGTEPETPAVTSLAPPPIPVPTPEPQTPVPAPQPQSSTPTPQPAPETPAQPQPEPGQEPVPSDNLPAMQEEMLEYINAARAQYNLAPLTLDDALCSGAYLKSKDMAENNYFSHTSPTYGSPFEMMKNLGISYRTAAENIAKNTSVKGARDAFMNSTGHRENILESDFTKVGLGFYQQGRYLYVTQWFTN